MISLAVWMTCAGAHAAVAADDVATRLEAVMAYRQMRITKSAPDIPASAYAKAADGTVATGLVDVEGHKARKAWGVGIVEVPIERVWAAVNDDRSKVEWTKLGHLELISGDYCAAERRVFQYLPVTLLADRWWVVDQTMNTALESASAGTMREVRWKSVGGDLGLTGAAAEWAARGIPVGFTEGSWLLVDLGDGHTLIEYYAWSDPGGSVPARLASTFAAGGINDTILAMANLARKGPTCL
jgi:hypothetical protein